MSKISEAQMEAFNEELTKLSSKWYARAAGAFGRFGQRQVHALTGWRPSGGMAAMKMENVPESLSSLPGLARGLASKPKETVREALKNQWSNTSLAEKALTVGLPAATTALDIMSPDDGHKGERIGAGIAGTAAGLLTGKMPLAGGMAAGLGASYLGGRVGHVFDKKAPKGYVQAPPRPEEAQGQHVPVERELSPAAAGRTEVFG